MTRSTAKRWAIVLAAAGGLWAAPVLRAQESPAGGAPAAASGLPAKTHDPVAAIKAGREMARAATNLWDALTPEQQKKMAFEFKSPERLNWHFVPRERKGLPLKDMTTPQRQLAHALLSTGMGQRGYVRATTIMSLEQVLHEIEKGRGQFARDPELYFFSVFGEPGRDKDAKEPWGWRVEGHHLALNFTIVGDAGIVGAPSFFGANPAEVREGPRKGLRVLADEEDLGRALVKSLTEDQKKKGIVSPEAPKDVLAMPGRKAGPLEPKGLTTSDLNDQQKQQLWELIELYANRLRPEMAAGDLDKIRKAGVDKVAFAWAGGTEPKEPHYYRIQGPTFLIEYDNTQNNANHIHTVWRDMTDDFAEDLLKKHYEQSPHGK